VLLSVQESLHCISFYCAFQRMAHKLWQIFSCTVYMLRNPVKLPLNLLTQNLFHVTRTTCWVYLTILKFVSLCTTEVRCHEAQIYWPCCYTTAFIHGNLFVSHYSWGVAPHLTIQLRSWCDHRVSYCTFSCACCDHPYLTKIGTCDQDVVLKIDIWLF